MAPHEKFIELLRGEAPVLALAPMQDVTDLVFMRVMARYGGPDVYWTEYFRVHAVSNLEKWILESITENPTGRPIVAQMIGNDIPSLVRTAKELQQYPIAAVDLNLGCPAPVVYRKCAGGGLLREPQKIDAILGALRDAVKIPLTVKTRVGFDSPAVFDQLLPIFTKHSIDLLTVHGRTVAQMYRPGVRYDLIAHAAREMRCPVLLNGNVHGPEQALTLLAETSVRGLMIGRGAIRNPWLFQQIRQVRKERAGMGNISKAPGNESLLPLLHQMEERAGERRNDLVQNAPLLDPLPIRSSWGEEEKLRVLKSSRTDTPNQPTGAAIRLPTGRDVLNYIRELWDAEITPGIRELSQVQRMKKFMNFIGEGVESPEKFLHDIRRVETQADFFRICESHLDHERTMTLEPAVATVTS